MPRELSQQLGTGAYLPLLLEYGTEINDRVGISTFCSEGSQIKSQDQLAIVEVGSRDALDTIDLLNFLEQRGSRVSHCTVFEPNPSAAKVCRENIARHKRGRDIRFVEAAAAAHTGRTNFFPIGGANPGASSLYPLNYDEPRAQWHTLALVPLPTIKVDCTTLDKHFQNDPGLKIDLLCMDVQGAEMEVLRGAAKHVLAATKIIVTEGQWVPLYQGSHLIDEIAGFLEEYGFVPMTSIENKGGSNCVAPALALEVE
eukprot:UC4_evm8s1442